MKAAFYFLTAIAVGAGLGTLFAKKFLVRQLASCPSIEVLERKQECVERDGGIRCELGDLAPTAWGLCLEDSKREFTCLLKGTISHYGTGIFPVWAIKAERCPALRQQLEKYGRDKAVMPVPALQPRAAILKEGRT